MAEEPRLLKLVTEAFVDRVPIDWTAVRSRARRSSDHALVETLSLLDALRTAARSAQRRRHTASRTVLPACLVIALAVLQILCSVFIMAIAFVNGATVTSRTPQAVLAVAFVAASLLLAAATSRDPRALFLLAAFACSGSAFVRSCVSGLPDIWSASTNPVIYGLCPEALAPACLWQFARDFPRVARFASFDVLARRATAVAWLLGLSLLGVNLLPAWQVFDQARVAYFLRDHPSQLFAYLSTLALIPPVGVLLVRSRRAPLSERRKVSRFAAAFAMGMAPFLMFTVARMVWPAIDEWFRNAGPNRVWLERLILASLAATPILCTAAVVADRPFELQARLHRSARQALARFLHALDWRLSRHPRGYEEHLAQTLERIRMARGTREIMSVLERALRKGLRVAAVRHLVPDAHAFADPARRDASLSMDSMLVALLRDTAGPIDVSRESEIYSLLPRQDRDWVAEHEACLVSAVSLRDGTVTAIIIVGSRRDGLPCDRRDRWLVATMTTAAAAAWDTECGTSVPDTPPDEAAFECPSCGVVADSMLLPCTCEAPPTLASLPRQLAGQYVVERRLGTGGMGVVYLARDTALDRLVALKTLPTLGPGAVARLHDEARAMAALNHESLATIYGLTEWRRTPVLIVEYLPGGTLADRIATGPLSPAAAVTLGLAVARALASMHARGVLHRDLKPSNIAFTATGAPKLLDFGLATVIDEAAHPSLAGTAAYLPPEAFAGTPATAAFDLWALAVVILEAITGRSPIIAFDRATPFRRAAAVDASALYEPLRRLHDPVCTFFERALAPEPRRRFRSATDLQSALEATLNSSTAA